MYSQFVVMHECALSIVYLFQPLFQVNERHGHNYWLLPPMNLFHRLRLIIVCYELMCSVSSLFDGALDAVMNHFIYFERELQCLPPNVKSKIAQRMCKRGLMTDHNAPLVSMSHINKCCCNLKHTYRTLSYVGGRLMTSQSLTLLGEEGNAINRR